MDIGQHKKCSQAAAEDENALVCQLLPEQDIQACIPKTSHFKNLAQGPDHKIRFQPGDQHGAPQHLNVNKNGGSGSTSTTHACMIAWAFLCLHDLQFRMLLCALYAYMHEHMCMHVYATYYAYLRTYTCVHAYMHTVCTFLNNPRRNVCTCAACASSLCS